ncbi:MAG TPA: hypothetical protein VI524_11295 [Anaerolineales bacterium]|nr:hypothetical protein [Anaerolineales bacterium]
MKGKDYTTARERMADQIMGFWAFPLVNVPLWFVLQRIDSQLPTLVSALPWVVNGIVLVLAFLFRPQFGVGYVAFIGIALTVVTGLSIVFVAACFVSLLSVAVIGPLAIVLFVLLMAAGLFGLAVIASYLIKIWQSSLKNNSH